MTAPPPNESFVANLRREFQAIYDVTVAQGAVPLAVSAQETYAKAMVIAAGNWCERRIREALEGFAGTVSGNDLRLVTLVRTRVLERQFHSLFNWKDDTPKGFYACFGDEFKKAALAEVKEDEALSRGGREFMLLNGERNRLAHDQNIDLACSFTVDEVYEKFLAAADWVLWMESKLR